ncbi:hypothetical protein [Neptunicella sp. SCSIO 80796]|uniref:hypothetical protein n=1 Tax=Neptunicella plasticusilytica TaxID=3117012 RepID=UPI003A4DEE2D
MFTRNVCLALLVFQLAGCGGGTDSGTSVESPPLNPPVVTPEPEDITTGKTIVRNEHFFVANDGIHGKELWKTDGSLSGTVMVKDINPDGDSRPSQLIYSNGYLFFSADDGVTGRELWKSDGTTEGTVLVKDVNLFGNTFVDRDAFIISKNNNIYFYGTDGVGGYELWKSDGTADGTSIVKELGPDGTSGLRRYEIFVMGDFLYFNGYSDIGGCALWKSDGTEIGTTTVKTFFPSIGRTCPSHFTNVGGVLFFSASDDNYGDELWKSDGTSDGTLMVKDINQFLSAGSTPRNLVAVNNQLYFTSNAQDFGHELWTSDGSELGTYMVSDIDPGEGSSSPRIIVNYDGVLFFIAKGPSECNTGIWKSNGTSETTQRLSDCLSTDRNTLLDDLNGTNGFEIFNDKMYFYGTNGFGDDLWVSDGTEFGTVPVTNFTFNPNFSFAVASYNANTELLAFHDNRFLIRIDDGIHGLELWISDGTESGTKLIKDINPGNADGFAW